MTLRFPLLAALLLSLLACAAPTPTRQPPPPAVAPALPANPPAAAPTTTQALPPLPADSPGSVQEPVRPTPALVSRTPLGADALLEELFWAASLSPEQRRRDLIALDGERRLSDVKRFQLAALLEREDSIEALERSLKNLNGLVEVDVRAQTLIELMRKALRARIELKQQSGRMQALQEKLEQIKALEKSLQQRTVPPRTP